MHAARKIRAKYKNKIISYSKNIFIPVTNICRNVCEYCGFRRHPESKEAKLLSMEEIIDIAKKGVNLGCKEALITLGEKPELKYPEIKEKINQLGFRRMSDYIYEICRTVLKIGLLPHTNAGVMDKYELLKLREVNVSMGLMLETTNPNLPAHRNSPGKKPEKRLKTLKYAGELHIPFTTGLLIGIGETDEDIINSLFEIKKINEKYKHIQEVIIQNFMPQQNTPMANQHGPSLTKFLRVIAISRLILKNLNIQVPPNLNRDRLGLLLMAGINDWGGISPITLDYINPNNPWPKIKDVKKVTESFGLKLKLRLPIYPEFINEKFVPKTLLKFILGKG
jgi:7,8-didemethyl-8-hydroxy-5-deazariboflavin synthase CofG subunit